ncbi:MAG TPA: aspartate kinase [Candidatus Acidoferrum sp.]|nr:aspartate kinase [Candidatus Acidoferrum sp.]
MKFGGTSVGDATSICRVVEIVRRASCTDQVIVVVSAMSGVTSKLVEVANRAGNGDLKQALAILLEVKQRHESAAQPLLPSGAVKNRVMNAIRATLQETEEVCRNVCETRVLTPEKADAIAGVGERLSVYLVAAALAKAGVSCEAIEATELIVTDEHHGAAEPKMEPTRAQCQKRLRKMLGDGVIPVITGYIGATEDGTLTTLGRNSSDYSATILGAALDADEVVIWTDVDGVLTADPRLVPSARNIAEISFSEATELARCGAKVLHAKCLHPIADAGIPLRICNTFAGEQPGTRVVPGTRSDAGEVKALAAVDGLALIWVSGDEHVRISDFQVRGTIALEAVGVDIRWVCCSNSSGSLAFIVASSAAEVAAKALRSEFLSRPQKGTKSRIDVQWPISVITAVGHNVCGSSEFLEGTFDVLARRHIRVLGVSRMYSDTSFSFVVASKHMQAALAAAHENLFRQAETQNLSVGYF